MSIAADLWVILLYRSDVKVKYLLWALIFRKIYEPEQTHATLTGVMKNHFESGAKHTFTYY